MSVYIFAKNMIQARSNKSSNMIVKSIDHAVGPTCGRVLGLVCFPSLGLHPFAVDEVPERPLMVIQPCLHTHTEEDIVHCSYVLTYYNL